MTRTMQARRSAIQHKHPLDIKPGDTVTFFPAHTDDLSVMMGYAAMDAIEIVGAENVFSVLGNNGEASSKGDPSALRAGDRVERARRELKALGGLPRNVIALDLGDGKLMEPENFNQNLVPTVGNIIKETGTAVAVTLGRHGGDFHPDHIAMHMAVVLTAGSVAVWGLNRMGWGQAEILADGRLKDKMSAIYESDDQFPMVPYADDSLPEGWIERGGFALPPGTVSELQPYQFFMISETYDRY